MLQHLQINNKILKSLLCFILVVAASAPVAERSVKLKGLSDSQVPQGSGLLC